MAALLVKDWRTQRSHALEVEPTLEAEPVLEAEAEVIAEAQAEIETAEADEAIEAVGGGTSEEPELEAAAEPTDSD